MHWKSAHDLWNKLKNSYKGVKKEKEVKLQFFRAQFESLKMEEDENIASHFLQVGNVVNSIIGIGE